MATIYFIWVWELDNLSLPNFLSTLTFNLWIIIFQLCKIVMLGFNGDPEHGMTQNKSLYLVMGLENKKLAHFMEGN